MSPLKEATVRRLVLQETSPTSSTNQTTGDLARHKMIEPTQIYIYLYMKSYLYKTPKILIYISIDIHCTLFTSNTYLYAAIVKPVTRDVLSKARALLPSRCKTAHRSDMRSERV